MLSSLAMVTTRAMNCTKDRGSSPERSDAGKLDMVDLIGRRLLPTRRRGRLGPVQPQELFPPVRCCFPLTFFPGLVRAFLKIQDSSKFFSTAHVPQSYE